MSTRRWNRKTACNVALLYSKETSMGLAEYMIVSRPDGWTVLHDGTAQHDYETKEAAFEAAVAAASLAIRQGHEVHLSIPGRDAGNKTALRAEDSQSAPSHGCTCRGATTRRTEIHSARCDRRLHRTRPASPFG